MNFVGASDWVLKRLVKLFLKKNLSQIIATELDVQQLAVQIDKGSILLQDCLLDVEFLNSKITDIGVEFEHVFCHSVEFNLFPFCINVKGALIKIVEKKRDYPPPADGDTILLESTRAREDVSSYLEQGLGVINELLMRFLDSMSFSLADTLFSVCSDSQNELRCKIKHLSFDSEILSPGKRRALNVQGFALQYLDIEGEALAGIEDIDVTAEVIERNSEQEPVFKKILIKSISPIQVFTNSSSLYSVQNFGRIFLTTKRANENKPVHLPENLKESLLRALNLSGDLNLEEAIGNKNFERQLDSADLQENEEDTEILLETVTSLFSSMFCSAHSTVEDAMNEASVEASETSFQKIEISTLIPSISVCWYDRTNFTSSDLHTDKALRVHVDNVACEVQMFRRSRQVDVSFEVLEITHHNGLGCSQHDTQTSLSLVGYRNLFKKILEETGEDIKFSFEDESALHRTVDELQRLRLNKLHSLTSTDTCPLVYSRSGDYMHRLTAKLEEHWVLSLQLSSIFTWLDYSRLMSLVKEVPSKAGSHDVEKGQSGSGLDFEIAVDFDSLNLVAFPGISDTTAFVCTMQSTGSTPFGSIKEHCLRILSLHGTLSLNAQARSLSVHTTTENAASEFLRTNDADIRVQYLQTQNCETVDISSPSEVLCLDIFIQHIPGVRYIIDLLSEDRDSQSIQHSRDVCMRVPNLVVNMKNSDDGLNVAYVCLTDAYIRFVQNFEVSCEGVEIKIFMLSKEEIDLFLPDGQAREEESITDAKIETCTADWLKIEAVQLEVFNILEQEINFIFKLKGFTAQRMHHGNQFSASYMRCHPAKPGKSEAVFNEIQISHRDYLQINVVAIEADLDLMGMREIQRLSQLRWAEITSGDALLPAESLLEHERSQSIDSSVSEIGYDVSSDLPGEYRISGSIQQYIVNNYIHAKERASCMGPFHSSVRVGHVFVRILHDSHEKIEQEGDMELTIEDICYWSCQRKKVVEFSDAFLEFSLFRQQYVTKERVFSIVRSLVQSRPSILVEHSGAVWISVELPGIEVRILPSFMTFIKTLGMELQDDSWERVSLNASGTTRYHLDVKGFAANLTYLPENFQGRAFRRGEFGELLNLMPEWSLNIWLCNCKIRQAMEIETLVNALLESWMDELRTVQLRRVATGMPGYTSLRQVDIRTRRYLESGSSIEDKVIRWLCALAKFATVEKSSQEDQGI